MNIRLVAIRYTTTLATILLASFSAFATARAQNHAPTIAGTPPPTVVQGTPYSFVPTATDADGDVLTFRAWGLPRWARFEKRTGRVYGTPSRRDVGTTRTITIAVSDGRLSAQLAGFRIEVLSNATVANGTPWISGSPATTAKEGDLYGFLPSAGDPDGDTLTFQVLNKPAWASFTSSSGLLSGIPPAGSSGTYSNIQVSVSDGHSSSALPPFSISVGAPANRPPTISGTPSTSVVTGQAYWFRPTASDPDGQPLAFSAINVPGWAAFDATTGTLAGTPSSTSVGTYANIVVSATDGQATATLAPFSITVTAANTAPKISGTPSTSATVGQAYSFAPTASDPDGQPLAFSIANRPGWASFSSTTGLLSGTPGAGSDGTYSNIVISVSDGKASSSLASFSIVVKSATSGSATLNWSPPTKNVDGTTLTNLAGYRIAYGQSSSSLTQQVDIPDASITSAMIEGLASGTWHFAIRSYTTANVMSDPTGVVSMVVN